MHLLISQNSLKKFLSFKKDIVENIEDLELLRFMRMALIFK